MSADHNDRLARIDSRNEFALRKRAGNVTGSTARELDDYLFRVKAHALRLLSEYPHLDTEGPGGLFSRMAGPGDSSSYDSALRRAAFALLFLRAVDRSEQASPFTGNAA